MPRSGRRGAVFPRGVTETTASCGSVPVTTSSSVAPGHRTARAPVAGDRRAGDGALVDVLEPVGAVPAEAHRTAAVHRDAHPAAPAQPGGVAGHRLDLDGPLEPGQALQLLRDPERLQASLRGDVHVLEVAAAAAPGPGVRAGRVDAVGRAGQDLDGIGPQEGGRAGGHPGPDALAGEAVADEDHPAVGVVGHAPPAGRDGAHLELQEVRIFGGHHGRGA